MMMDAVRQFSRSLKILESMPRIIADERSGDDSQAAPNDVASLDADEGFQTVTNRKRRCRC